jgi:hypothetical protein
VLLIASSPSYGVGVVATPLELGTPAGRLGLIVGIT